MELTSLTAKCHFTRPVVIGVLAMALSPVPVLSASGATFSSSPPTVSSFLGLAERGLSGTFSESYRVTQGSPSEGYLSGTVDLAQHAPPGQLHLTKSTVRWSFVYLAQVGPSRQWIEKGSRVWDCIRDKGAAKWTCSGPGPYEPSNGFALAIQPYIPGVVLDNISEVTNGLKTHQAMGIHFSTSTSSQFGPLQCMEALGTTSCLDQQGVLVSQQGGSYWTTIALLRRSASAPTSAFTLRGKSTSSGRKFELLL